LSLISGCEPMTIPFKTFSLIVSSLLARSLLNGLIFLWSIPRRGDKSVDIMYIRI